MDIVNEIRNLVAEVPENVGKLLVAIGTELEELAARVAVLEGKSDAPTS